VCRDLQELVDFLFSEYSHQRNVDMVAVADKVGELVQDMGLDLANSLLKCQMNCVCQRCVMRARLLQKKLAMKRK